MLKKDKYYKIKQVANKAQMARVLLDFWCMKCEWQKGRVPDCEEVCTEAILEWLNKEDKK